MYILSSIRINRARFKKRTNAFAAAGRTTPVRRLNRVPGSGCRLDSQRISYCPSPLPPPVVTTSNLPKGHVIEASSSNQKHKSSNRVSLVKI